MVFHIAHNRRMNTKEIYIVTAKADGSEIVSSIVAGADNHNEAADEVMKRHPNRVIEAVASVSDLENLVRFARDSVASGSAIQVQKNQ